MEVKEVDRKSDRQTYRPTGTLTSRNFGTGHLPLLFYNFVWNFSQIHQMVKKLWRVIDRIAEFRGFLRILKIA